MTFFPKVDDAEFNARRERLQRARETEDGKPATTRQADYGKPVGHRGTFIWCFVLSLLAALAMQPAAAVAIVGLFALYYLIWIFRTLDAIKDSMADDKSDT